MWSFMIMHREMTKEELRDARKEMEMTQEDAADKYQVSIRSYKAYELGEAKIPGPVKLLTKYLLKEFRKKY